MKMSGSLLFWTKPKVLGHNNGRIFSYNIKFTFNACGKKRIDECFRQVTFI